MLVTTVGVVLAIHESDVARSFSRCSNRQVLKLSLSRRRAAPVLPFVLNVPSPAALETRAFAFSSVTPDTTSCSRTAACVTRTADYGGVCPKRVIGFEPTTFTLAT